MLFLSAKLQTPFALVTLAYASLMLHVVVVIGFTQMAWKK